MLQKSGDEQRLQENLEKVQRLVDQPPALENFLHCYIINRTP